MLTREGRSDGTAFASAPARESPRISAAPPPRPVIIIDGRAVEEPLTEREFLAYSRDQIAKGLAGQRLHPALHARRLGVIVDFDDFHASNHRLDLLERLHDANPLFRCTLFAVPACGDDRFWARVPEWCELAVHGWLHPHPREAENWSYEQALDVFGAVPSWFVDGFKAPGWQISDGTYTALVELGWWVADQPYNDERRPKGLPVHRLGDGDHLHGHIQNVCGNGLEECFDEYLERVNAAKSFELISEVVKPWQ